MDKKHSLSAVFINHPQHTLRPCTADLHFYEPQYNVERRVSGISRQPMWERARMCLIRTETRPHLDSLSRGVRCSRVSCAELGKNNHTVLLHHGSSSRGKSEQRNTHFIFHSGMAPFRRGSYFPSLLLQS